MTDIFLSVGNIFNIDENVRRPLTAKPVFQGYPDSVMT